MEKPILVIMAAGLGSRFGGGSNKQTTAIDDQGHIIIDYSIFDAISAGFGKIVCVINPANEEAFHAAIGQRIAQKVDLSYAYQTIDMLPEGFTVPANRTKPWGTGHAVLSAKKFLNAPFAVINADDYYGREAFEQMARFLTTDADPNAHAMIGYKVENTLTENGGVSRGVCTLEGDMLVGVTERTEIQPEADGAFYPDNERNRVHIDCGTIVSMNFWGFKPSAVPKLESYFADFLRELAPEKAATAEYYLPSVPNRMLQEHTGTVHVLPTTEKWYGMTYHDDLPRVQAAIAAMQAEGKYPKDLWRD